MGTSEAGLNAFCIMILLQAYGGQGVECGSLNVTDPHNLIGSDTIRRCGFGGVGMALIEEVSLWGWTLRFPVLSTTQCLSQLPVACNMQLSQLLQQHHACPHSAKMIMD